jgi:hypothetical protein
MRKPQDDVLRLPFERPLRGGKNQRALRQLQLRVLVAAVIQQVLHLAAATLSEVVTVSATLIVLAEPAAMLPTLAILTAVLTEAVTLMSALALTATAFAPVASVIGVLVLMRAQHAAQHREARLLLVVEARIKRRATIGDLLQRGATLRHGVGTLAHPVERTGRGLRLRLLRSLMILHALDPQLNHVAERRFECRPVFCLVGREFETRLQRGDACVGECIDVVSAHPVMMLGTGTALTKTIMTAETLLCVDKGRAADDKRCRRGDYGLEHVILHRVDVRK